MFVIICMRACCVISPAEATDFVQRKTVPDTTSVELRTGSQDATYTYGSSSLSFIVTGIGSAQTCAL